MTDYFCAVCKQRLEPDPEGGINAKSWADTGPGGNVEVTDGPAGKRYTHKGPRLLAHHACALKHPKGPPS